ncbi:accessory gene regulator AgrB [Clostridium carboxidivorans P7]|uniref:Accessory gene regulator B n=1 Tax=Clostridium carboxidivorans P7 TaxID=536227 RepID=C6Q1V6_9CLOT|nr:accessory gene regulator B family protein [Clostridium carboxidivorans]AKN32905.1 accessory gene regulator AgrB [Clostridium carboxidivorans P7]EET84532.1 Accessory gene regulator B [Clostridium carboxidivorans P7]EFG89841.1 accessory protein regulator protein B [Clostridium carboxidivorans P7]
MIYKLSRKIAKDMVNNNIVKFGDYEIYLYGIQSIISSIVDILVILIISAFWGQALYSVIFIIFFCTLRINAGGYHASSYFKCLIFITSINFLAIALVNNVKVIKSPYFIIASLLFSIFLILKYCPVDTPNKPLNSEEKQLCRRRSIITFIIQSIIILSIYFIKSSFGKYCSIAALALLSETMLLLPISNMFKKKVCIK